MDLEKWTLCSGEQQCSRCETVGKVYFRDEEDSGGHEDTQYWCTACNNKWWVEGSDA